MQALSTLASGKMGSLMALERCSFRIHPYLWAHSRMEGPTAKAGIFIQMGPITKEIFKITRQRALALSKTKQWATSIEDSGRKICLMAGECKNGNLEQSTREN